MQTQAIVQYLLNQAKPRPAKVGLIASTDEGSQEAAKFLRAGMTAGGITDIVERKVPANATDLTEAVLAMRGTDATLQWSFPTIDSLFLRQKRQERPDHAPYGDNSGSSITGNKLNTGAELAGYNYATACDPDLATTAQAQSYVAAQGQVRRRLDQRTTGPGLRRHRVSWRRRPSRPGRAIPSAVGRTGQDGLHRRLRPVQGRRPARPLPHRPDDRRLRRIDPQAAGRFDELTSKAD